MKLLKIKKVSEIIFAIVLIIFLVLPLKIPHFFTMILESSLGMICLLMLSIGLFLYSNPYLAILFMFVIYELLRRSSRSIIYSQNIQYTPTEAKRDDEMRKMNEPRVITLEEDMVSKMAPLESNDSSHYIDSTFKPVSEDTHNAFAMHH
jgi:hypothetical protein